MAVARDSRVAGRLVRRRHVMCHSAANALYMYGDMRASSRDVSDPRERPGTVGGPQTGVAHVPAAIQTGIPGRHRTPAVRHRRRGRCRRQRAAAVVVTFDTAVDHVPTRPRNQRLAGSRHADERALGVRPLFVRA